MICIFDKENTTFTGNGNAVLMPTECRAKMIAGGSYDMTMTHPIDPEGKWKHIEPGAVIRIPVPTEEIENAFSGYAADVYKTNTAADLREGPSEPTAITYTTWSITADYAVGDKVSWQGKNYKCSYYDETSAYAHISPPNSSWWTEIPNKTAGSAVLVSLSAGAELYFVQDVDSTWYKMSTYYGVEGYIKKSQVTFYQHLEPEEVQPRVITTQLLRVTNATADTKNRTVSVTAQHVSYDMNGIIVRNVKFAEASPGMAISRITDGFMIPYPGIIATNLTSQDNGTYSEEIKGKSGTYCLMDPDKGLVKHYDAALKRDNWDLMILKRVTTDRGFRLKYRKNMLGVNWAQKSDSVITRVVPVAKAEGGEDLFLDADGHSDPWVDSPLIGQYPVIRMEMLKVNGQVGKDKGLGDDSTWTLSDLLAEMRTKAEERFSIDKVDRIVREVTVDFEMLGDTAEHAWLKPLESVLLYDTVHVENEQIGLSESLTVEELEWDAIREKVTALKLSNVGEMTGRNVTGYNVQNKSISPAKLTDDVAEDIVNQVRDILPEYTDPGAARPGIVSVTDGDPTLAWNTRSKVGTVAGTDLHVTMPGNPAVQLFADTVGVEQGYWAIANGSPVSSNTWCRTTGYVSKYSIFDVPSPYSMFLIAYNKNTDAYVGSWNGTAFSTTYAASGKLLHIDVRQWMNNYPDYIFKIDFFKNDAAFVPSDVLSVITVTDYINDKVTPTESNLTVNVGTNLTQYGWGGSKVRKIGSLLIYTLAISNAPTTAKLTSLATIPNGFKPISDRAFGAGGTGSQGDEPVMLLIDTSRSAIMATGETKGYITGTIICYAG